VHAHEIEIDLIIMNIKNFKIGFIILGVLIILNLLLFLYYFHNQTVSRNISDWASFASYIGGTTNTLISIMTLLVTFFIAYEISKIEGKRNTANIEYDRKKFKRELREKAYAEVSENLNDFWFAITNGNRQQTKDSLFIIRTRFISFIKHKKHLFPDIKPSEFQNLDNILKEVLNQASKKIDVDTPEMIKLVEDFQKEISLFHKRIQEYILSE